MIDQGIRLCGGRNIFGDIKIAFPAINTANLIAANPQIIIVNDKNQINDFSKYPSLQAIRNKQVYFISPDLMQRHSPQILEGITTLCKLINKTRKNSTILSTP